MIIPSITVRCTTLGSCIFVTIVLVGTLVSRTGTLAAGISSKELYVVGNDLYSGTVLPVLLPAILAEFAVNANRLSFLQILIQGLAPLPPEYDIEKVRLFFPLIAVFARTVYGNGEFANRLA